MVLRVSCNLHYNLQPTMTTLYCGGTIQKCITYYMTSFVALHNVTITSANLFRWWH